MSRARQAEDSEGSLAVRGRGLLGCVLAALACALPRAQAQVGITASATSEYVARGMSLSQGQAAPQLRLDYDAAGWYAGALLSPVHLDYKGADTQVLAYGGYARRLPSGFGWEAGVLGATLTGSSDYRYHELYAGLSGERVAGRVYYSPSYYGDAATVYAELNGSVPLRDGLALVGHVGLLHPLGSAEDEARRRLDLRVGLSLDSGNWNFQLALLANGPRRHGPEAPRALQVSASYGF
jgi:uncharacterized protein (TIGR02001 family)